MSMDSLDSQCRVPTAESILLSYLCYCVYRNIACQKANTVDVLGHTTQLSHLGARKQICQLTWQPGLEEICFDFKMEIIAIFNPMVLICQSELLDVLLHLGNTLTKLLLPISFELQSSVISHGRKTRHQAKKTILPQGIDLKNK